jgi:branched-chain amino acid transport system permease protein
MGRRFARRRPWTRLGLLAAALAAGLGLAPVWTVRATLVGIYAIGTLGQNLLIGNAGQVSFGQAGFLALGAYAFSHLRLEGTPFLLALVTAGLLAAGAGAVVGLPALRLKGPYLAIATLGFAVAADEVLAATPLLSGGRAGLTVLPLEPVLGLSRGATLYLVVLALLVVFTAATCSLVSSYVGRAFAAIRDDEMAAAALGVSLPRYKLLAFALSSFYTGAQGALLAQFLGHLEPQSFTLAESVTLLVAVTVGGLGSVEGSLLGAAFVVLLPSLFGGVPGAVPFAFGLGVILVLLFEPSGLAGPSTGAGLPSPARPFR